MATSNLTTNSRTKVVVAKNEVKKSILSVGMLGNVTTVVVVEV